jgi:hypothetical protein
MTTRRRIIYCILSALWFASCSLINSGPPQRIVRVKALADPSFRARNPGWDQEVRGVIESASDYFEREFAIRLVTESTAPWPAEERIPSTANLLVKLRHEFPVQENDGSYDLLVVFTAESVSRYLPSGRSRVDRIGDCQQGLGSYIVTTAHSVFRYQGANSELGFDVLTFIHELGHIFGATHVDDRSSIMHEDFGYRTEFDLGNRSIIQKNRTCAFAK